MEEEKEEEGLPDAVTFFLDLFISQPHTHTHQNNHNYQINKPFVQAP